MPDVATFSEITKLEQKLASATLPVDLAEKAHGMIDRAKISLQYGGFFSGLEQVSGYVDWITSLPWNTYSRDVLDLNVASQILEKHHYGLKDVKDRILEYLSVLRLKQGEGQMRAPILCFVGLVGTGKTTIAYAIAEAMGRQIVRIPFGGMGSALDLRGQSRVHPDSEPGLVIKALRRARTKNPVLLLDEIDRVSEQARADIMGVLIELLDPQQNVAFMDHYIDYPFDLTQALFIATANNTTHIATAVLDRLEPIQMPSYTDDEKIIIAKNYVMPKIMETSGLHQGQLLIADDVWPLIVRPLGFDSGIRTLERTVNGICRRVARLVVEGKGSQFTINNQNIKQFVNSW